ncbi:MAG: hypothetical protein CVV21_10305 [Candidatus Goldiibacteriota bacterium HGW-Goldbacteria-1]|jgi:predicted nucleotidyltransferase|nr:MAG: hypothetical protein CVV21_10305 [Candidatus Goldiibacteriota bacterium HGW-Goldbacteria-1]
MKLNSSLSELFNTQSKITLINYILTSGFNMTGRELSRVSGISHSQVILILKIFESYNLVLGRRAGKSVVWSAKPGSYAFKSLVRIFKNSELLNPVSDLIKRLQQWSLNNSSLIYKSILFGSVSSGSERLSSDIDFYVLAVSTEAKDKTLKQLEELSLSFVYLYGNTLSPYILTKKERSAIKNKALLKNIDGGIVIYDKEGKNKRS